MLQPIETNKFTEVANRIENSSTGLERPVFTEPAEAEPTSSRDGAATRGCSGDLGLIWLNQGTRTISWPQYYYQHVQLSLAAAPKPTFLARPALCRPAAPDGDVLPGDAVLMGAATPVTAAVPSASPVLPSSVSSTSPRLTLVALAALERMAAVGTSGTAPTLTRSAPMDTPGQSGPSIPSCRHHVTNPVLPPPHVPRQHQHQQQHHHQLHHQQQQHHRRRGHHRQAPYSYHHHHHRGCGGVDARVHADWRTIISHTAVCDMCDRRGHSILQRCAVRGCSLQVCQPCAVQGRLDSFTHRLDETCASWLHV